MERNRRVAIKALSFVALFAIYIAGSLVAAYLFGSSSDVTIAIFFLGAILAGGLATGIGVME